MAWYLVKAQRQLYLYLSKLFFFSYKIEDQFELHVKWGLIWRTRNKITFVGNFWYRFLYQI